MVDKDGARPNVVLKQCVLAEEHTPRSPCSFRPALGLRTQPTRRRSASPEGDRTPVGLAVSPELSQAGTRTLGSVRTPGVLVASWRLGLTWMGSRVSLPQPPTETEEWAFGGRSDNRGTGRVTGARPRPGRGTQVVRGPGSELGGDVEGMRSMFPRKRHLAGHALPACLRPRHNPTRWRSARWDRERTPGCSWRESSSVWSSGRPRSSRLEATRAGEGEGRERSDESEPPSCPG